MPKWHTVDSNQVHSKEHETAKNIISTLVHGSDPFLLDYIAQCPINTYAVCVDRAVHFLPKIANMPFLLFL